MTADPMRVRQVIRDATTLFTASGAASFVTLLQVAILTRHLGLAAFGAWSVMVVVVDTVSLLFTYRTWEVLFRFYPEYRIRGRPDHAYRLLRAVMAFDLATSAAAYVALALAVAAFPAYLPEIEARNAALVYGITIVGSSLDGALCAVLRTHGDFRNMARWTVGSALVRLAAAMVVLSNPSLAALAATMALASLLSGGWLLWMTLPLLRRAQAEARCVISHERVDWATIARFTLRVATTNVLKTIYARVDEVLLSYIVVPRSVGLYRVGKMVVGLLGRVSNPLYSAVYPRIAEAIAEGSERLGPFIGRLERLLVAIFVPLGVFVYWLAPQLVEIFAGSAFLDSAAVARVLVWAQVVVGPALVCQPVLAMSDRVGLSNAILVIGITVWPVALGLLPGDQDVMKIAYTALASSTVTVGLQAVAAGYALHHRALPRPSPATAVMPPLGRGVAE
jgi:O-antigen/teichoic acid export membrane protein